MLPIGGLKQKVLAAHRAGLTEAILPKRNEGDLEDVPEQVREQTTFHIAEDIADVLEVAPRAEAAPAASDAADPAATAGGTPAATRSTVTS